MKTKMKNKNANKTSKYMVYRNK